MKNKMTLLGISLEIKIIKSSRQNQGKKFMNRYNQLIEKLETTQLSKYVKKWHRQIYLIKTYFKKNGNIFKIKLIIQKEKMLA